MPIMRAETSTLLLIDFQAKLMPAIDHAAATLANARRLVDAAGLVGAPVLFTEQNPKGLGPTVAELAPDPSAVLPKMTFGAVGAPDFFERLAPGRDAVVGGWEAHVCVLQTVLALIEAGRRVFVVSDAVGSRRPESKEIALQRMARSGAEIVTMEMVVFEWLQTAGHPRFKEAIALISSGALDGTLPARTGQRKFPCCGAKDRRVKAEESGMPQPFMLRVPDSELADLRARLARARFPDGAPGDPWAYGTSVDYLRSLVDYWRGPFARAGGALEHLPAVQDDAAGLRPPLSACPWKGTQSPPLASDARLARLGV
jgi:nicotinamidase-related amidase